MHGMMLPSPLWSGRRSCVRQKWQGGNNALGASAAAARRSKYAYVSGRHFLLSQTRQHQGISAVTTLSLGMIHL